VHPGNEQRNSRWLLRAIVALFVPVLLPPGISAQEDGGRSEAGPTDAHAARPAVQAVRLQGAIDLDGQLREPEWSLAPPATEFTQTDPREGQPATERTEVHVLFDDDALYVGARLFQSGKINTRLGRRDTFLMDSDWFYVMLDSYHGHLSAYQFSINPSGVKRDELSTSGGPGSGGNGDVSWDAVWDVATSIDPEGWTVELRIPFSQLRFTGGQVQTWGIQFSRRIIGKDELVVFAYTPKSERGGVSRFGHLNGLQSLKTGKKLEVLPYLVSRAEYLEVDSGDPFRDGSDYFYSGGLDLKYRVTSALTLDATMNPDFGQVEVDPAVVNLTAFETSFDEKRPFFVEGNDIFRFNEMRLFYSRRVGRSPQGSLPDGAGFSNRPDASTILGAAKLTGRTASGWNIGVVEAVTSQESAEYIDANGETQSAMVEPVTNHFVGRAEKTLREGQSAVGGIVTAVHRGLDDERLDSLLRSSAYTAGLDFNHEFASRSWAVGGYFAYSRVTGSPESILRAQLSSSRYFERPDADYVEVDSSRTRLDGFTGRLELRKIAGEHWRGQANISAISPGFEINDMGFQTAVDRLGADVNITYVENTPGELFRNYRIESRTSRDFNFGWEPVGGRTQISLNGQFVNYWGSNVNFTRNFAAFDDRLTRGGPITRNLADWSFNFNVNTDNRRRVNARTNASYNWGESGSWNGNISFNLSLRPAESWTISAGPNFRRNYTPAQYVSSETDSSAVATFGKSYIFTPLDQTTLSMETRLNVNFTPEISLEVFAQPFISSGDYHAPIRLRAARTFDFEPYGGTIEDRDFNTRSVRGNAVLRWEWQPGSTLFLVWQQRRAGDLACAVSSPRCRPGRFEFRRDAREMFDARPNNVFLVKMNYWLNL
jgi:hypothetical protein